ncbi:MAG: cytochrome c maturation protein CcmE [Pseudomonadota bacterium]
MTKKQRRATLIGGISAIAGLAIILVLIALRSSVAYFYTPTDLAALETNPEGTIRLGGLVEADSVEFSPMSDAVVTFTIEDGSAAIDVFFEGVLPDLFREGQGVVVQGNLDPDGTLMAMEVLAKHDENYMPKEVADALKEQGVWQEGSENQSGSDDKKTSGS